MTSLGDDEVHGMAASEAKGIEDSIDEEAAVPVNVEPIQSRGFVESVPEESEEALKPRMMSIPHAPSRQEVLEHQHMHC